MAFYFPSKERGEFFDSYGHPPDYYNNSFKNFLKHFYEWSFNDRKLQSGWTDVCGKYCIFYLSDRARGQSMKKIMHLFANNTEQNDSKVAWFVKTHFRVVPKQPNVGQCCKKLFQ